jgi:hypothetical protein
MILESNCILEVHLKSDLISVTRYVVTPRKDNKVMIAIALVQNGPNAG